MPKHDPARESDRLALADIERTGSLAWAELTWGNGPEFAQALNRGVDLIEKMGRPQCPQRPPNVQLAYALLRGAELGLSEAQVLAPLRWLNELFRQLAYTAPEVTGLRAACLNLVLAHCTKELADYTHLAAELLAGEQPLGPELPRLKKELDEAIRGALELQKTLEQVVLQERRNGARLVSAGEVAG